MLTLTILLVSQSIAGDRNFSSGTDAAVKFGVHEIVLQGNGGIDKPFDTLVTVEFVPLSGTTRTKSVQAFFDGDNIWKARVYSDEVGDWSWTSTSDKRLDGQKGTFAVRDSKLRGRLLPHPENARQWITKDGRWFLNINDTAYFLLCTHDATAQSVADGEAMRYVRDDVARGITSIRCFMVGSKNGFAESSKQWANWYFEDDTFASFRLDNLQCTDRRLRTGSRSKVGSLSYAVLATATVLGLAAFERVDKLRRTVVASATLYRKRKWSRHLRQATWCCFQHAANWP